MGLAYIVVLCAGFIACIVVSISICGFCRKLFQRKRRRSIEKDPADFEEVDKGAKEKKKWSTKPLLSGDQTIR